MKKVRKYFVLVLMIFGLIVSSMSVTAASSNQRQAKKTVVNFFKYAKRYDTAKMKKCFVSPQKVKLFESKKYMKKFFQTANKDLHYKIISVKASRKTAVVKVYCEYYDAFDIFQYSFSDVVDYLIDYPRASSSKVDKYQYQRAVRHKKKADRDYGKTFDYNTITIKLKKAGKSWRITSYTKAMNNIIHCNYQAAYDDWF